MKNIVTAWTNDPIDPITGNQNTTMYRLAVYGGLGLGEGIISFLYNF